MGDGCKSQGRAFCRAQFSIDLFRPPKILGTLGMCGNRNGRLVIGLLAALSCGMALTAQDMAGRVLLDGKGLKKGDGVTLANAWV